MFATLEEKIIVAAIVALGIVVGILGYNHHERHEGATVCVQQQSQAATAEFKQETSDGNAAVADFSKSLDSIPITASRTPTLFVCDASGSVRKVPTALATQSSKPAVVHGDSGVLPRVEPASAVDIGPAVHDITLGCMQVAADTQELWQLAIKESQK
jgi:hypothetical protein